jgi:hypothetical protein
MFHFSFERKKGISGNRNFTFEQHFQKGSFFFSSVELEQFGSSLTNFLFQMKQLKTTFQL